MTKKTNNKKLLTSWWKSNPEAACICFFLHSVLPIAWKDRTVEMKAIEQYFAMSLFVIFYNVILTFQSMYKIL